MTTAPKIFTAERIVAGTIIGILLYTLWRGPERFCYESFGTLVLSPVIYSRLLPSPVDHWLNVAMIHQPGLCYFLCAVPVLLLIAAAVIAGFALKHRSSIHAWASCLLVVAVFSTYHLLQPMGITFQYF